MEKLKKMKFDRILQAVATIIVGIVLIFWTKASLDLITRILAILLIIVGAVFIVAYFARKGEKDIKDSGRLGLGIVVAALGIWIFINPGTFTDFIPKLFGIFILIGGIINLTQTISLFKYQYTFWWLSLIFALITVGLGVFLLLNPTEFKEFVVRVIGFILVYDGASDIWTISRLVKLEKKFNQTIRDAAAIDTEATIVNKDSAEQ